MGNPTPPGWGKDPVSSYIDAARDNQLAAFARYPVQFKRLVRVDSALRRLAENLSQTPDWFPGVFITRAHSAFLAASSAALCGQSAEVYAAVRLCLEHGLYALHSAKGSGRVRVFLDRHAPGGKSAVIGEFAYKRLLGTVKSIDAKLAETVSGLYERLIDFGAHPNEKGISGSTAFSSTEEGRKLLVSYIQPGDSTHYKVALLTTMQVGVTVIGLSALVFPERFELLRLPAELAALKAETAAW